MNSSSHTATPGDAMTAMTAMTEPHTRAASTPYARPLFF